MALKHLHRLFMNHTLHFNKQHYPKGQDKSPLFTTSCYDPNQEQPDLN